MLFFGVYLLIGMIITGVIVYGDRGNLDDSLSILNDWNISDTMKYICIISIWALAWPIELVGAVVSIFPHNK